MVYFLLGDTVQKLPPLKSNNKRIVYTYTVYDFPINVVALLDKVVGFKHELGRFTNWH